MRPSEPGTAAWSTPTRVGFRFAFAYLGLYNLPFPMGVLPGTSRLAEAMNSVWTALTLWTGRSVLGIKRDFALVPNGSGDQTFNFVQNFCVLALAALVTILWSAADRSRPAYKHLLDGIRVYVRYALGYTMLAYGMYKVFKSQFPAPSPMRLFQPYGDSSPMGLLWTFMGHSTPYTMLAGAAEAIGGLLLFFRRTTTLGALLLLGVIGNVVSLNFCYDVPVKLYSTNLWLMAVFLLLPEFRRLAEALVPKTALPTGPLVRPFGGRGANRAFLGLKALLIALFVHSTFTEAWNAMRTHGDGAPVHPLDGIYEVEEFTVNGVVVAPLLTETGRWRYLALSYGATRMYIKSVDDTYEYYSVKDDGEKKTWTVTLRDDPKAQRVLSYERPDGDHLTLAGPWGAHAVSVRLRKIDATEKFLLTSRGFRWINEAPFNR